MSKGLIERKEELVDRLQRREEARLAEVEKKKAEKDRLTAAHEQTNFFTVTFNQAKDDLELKLAEAKLLDRHELVDYFNKLVKDYQKLQKFLADSTMFLPSYDIKVAQDVLKSLQESIQNSQDTLLPKKKFAFKSKKKWLESGKDIIDHVKSIVESKEVSVELESCGFKDLSQQKLQKYPHEVNKQDVGLYRLKECEAKIYGAPTTIRMSGLKNCQILIGPVSTSVFIEDCTNCIFSLACQQLRVHRTISTVIYLHVVSRTIIEDCEDLKFAPYNWVYDSMDSDFELANINKNQNNWQSIDDFNWLVAGVPSPNWCVLDDEERAQFWN